MRKLTDIKDESINLILTHLPYADIIKYGNGELADDLSDIYGIYEFVGEM